MSEALARRARLHWVAGKTDAAREATRAARAQTGSVIEPLRANALALMEVLTSTQAGATPDRVALDVLESIVTHCAHPLVHARHWRAQAALAAWRGDSFAALGAAHRLAVVARQAGLLESLCEALALIARFDPGSGARAQALTLAQAQGLAWLLERIDDAPRGA